MNSRTNNATEPSAPTSQKAKELAARLREWVSVGATKRWPTRSMDDDMLAVIEYLESPDGPESDGWNAGIEAAAKLVDERHDPCEPWLTGDEVRALKRPEAGADDEGDWQCEDPLADGWITFPNRKAAEHYQKKTGVLMRYRRLYPAPNATDSGVKG